MELIRIILSCNSKFPAQEYWVGSTLFMTIIFQSPANCKIKTLTTSSYAYKFGRWMVYLHSWPCPAICSSEQWSPYFSRLLFETWIKSTGLSERVRILLYAGKSQYINSVLVNRYVTVVIWFIFHHKKWGLKAHFVPVCSVFAISDHLLISCLLRSEDMRLEHSWDYSSQN